MAKGLRSKAKRANRAALREQLTIPMQIQRQENIAKKIKEGLNETAKSKSISTIRSALNGSRAVAAKKVASEPVSEVASSSKTVAIEPKKRSGSKPRINPNKELSWFK